jgi:inner membrane transporter RhtA
MADETPQRSRVAAAGPLVSAVSVQSGAAFGTTLIPVIGPVGVVGLRQLFAALVLLIPLIRSRRTLRWHGVKAALLLGVILVVMNITIYMSLARIDLGLAVTLEFLGPLALALFASRRALDLICGLAAGIGVFLLTGTIDDVDFLGVLLALVAGAAWACYIVIGQRVADRMSGTQGTAVASGVAALITLPFLIAALTQLPADEFLRVLSIGLAVGVLSSALPYSIDIAVLRRIPRGLFSVLQSVHPAVAALAGLVILGQTLTVLQVIGLAAISAANAAAVLGSAHRERLARRAERALTS